MYVDAKMRLASDWGSFLREAQASFDFRFGDSQRPALVSCIDRMGAKHDRLKATLVWQGLLAATRAQINH